MHNKLIELIQEHALQYGEFKLSSGATSPYFIDMSKLTNHAEGLDLITAEIVRHLGRVGTDVDAIGGPAMGAAPLIGGTLINHRRDNYGLAMSLRGFLVRKEAKDGEFIEGNLKIGDRILVVEDVVTTGRQTKTAIERIEAAGGKVVKTIAVVDRLAGAAELLERWNFTSLVTINQLLPP